MRKLVLGLAFVLVGVAGCASPVAPNPTPSPTVVSIMQALGSASYPLDLASGGTVKLNEGEYVGSKASGSATKLTVRLMDTAATGDLNGDGVDDAAVILSADPGGSGTFYYLAAALNEDGSYHVIASVFLGDRIEVKSLKILAPAIEVTLLDRALGQPMASPPTVETTSTYQLQANQLVKVP